MQLAGSLVPRPSSLCPQKKNFLCKGLRGRPDKLERKVERLIAHVCNILSVNIYLTVLSVVLAEPESVSLILLERRCYHFPLLV